MIHNTLRHSAQHIQFCKYRKRILIGKIILLLQLQQGAFAVYTAGIACESATGTNNTVTWDDNGDGIAPYGTAHCLCRRRAEIVGQLAICHRLTIGDGKQSIPNAHLELGALQRQRRHEVGLGAREIDFQPLTCNVEYRQISAFLMLRGKGASVVLLPVKPQSNQRLAVTGQRNTSKMRVVVCCKIHYPKQQRPAYIPTGRALNCNNIKDYPS